MGERMDRNKVHDDAEQPQGQTDPEKQPRVQGGEEADKDQ